MNRFLKRLHFYLSGISLFLFFLVLYPFLYFFSRKPSRYLYLNKVRKLYGFLSSGAVGIFYAFTFEQKIDWSQTYILCPNHTSNLDITAMAVLMPFSVNYAFLGKEELLRNPITALFFKTIDIPFNRESKMSAFRAFKRAEDYLKSGISLIIFPEGKIPEHYPPYLDSFKNGPFRLAIEQQVPILPVSVTDAWEKAWDDGAEYGTRPGICHICVHAPVYTNGLTVSDTDTLREKVWETMNKELRKNEAG